MIEVSYSWNGRGSTGVEINGLDIGAHCLRSIYMERENRRVIKVKGWSSSGHFNNSRIHPQFFLITDDKVVANIEYDRSDIQKAKDLVSNFIIMGQIPVEYKL